MKTLDYLFPVSKKARLDVEGEDYGCLAATYGWLAATSEWLAATSAFLQQHSFFAVLASH